MEEQVLSKNEHSVKAGRAVISVSASIGSNSGKQSRKVGSKCFEHTVPQDNK